jgi:uncharacterized protein (DUF433 family)
MEQPTGLDKYDWRGCEAVQFNPRKLGGRATVLDTRMDADGIIIHYLGGMDVDEIHDHFRVDKNATRAIVEFFEAKRMKISA